ncbi:hypothetical protein ABZZ80_25840, partial [Streptomyces sp. NPDC006356]
GRLRGKGHTMSHMDRSEEEELLRRGLRELTLLEAAPAGSPGPAALIARGRRALWRRRAATVTASVVLAGAVGTGGAYSVLAGAEEDVYTAAEVDAGRAVSILKELLPTGKVSEERGARSDGADGAYLSGSLVFDDGGGPAAISMELSRTDSPGASIASLATCRQGADGVGRWGPDGTCTEKTLADGAELLLTQERKASPRGQDVKSWSARLIKPDGSMLTLTEWNAAAGSDAEPTREDPPLSQKQLNDVVTAKEWLTTLDSFPRRGGGVEDPDAPDSSALLGTLGPLLPSGLRTSGDTGGTSPTDFAGLRVNDGQGEGAVEVNVDHRGTNGSDHVRIDERQGPSPWSDKGATKWSVTAVRPGGFRVTVSAYNAGHAFGEPTRSLPPLMMNQLRAVATSETWDRFE